MIEAVERRLLLTSYTASTLVSFHLKDIYSPVGLTVDSQGDLFGVTVGGGDYRNGTAYEVAAGIQTISTLASFSPDQGAPDPGLAIDTNGNLYGTTTTGAIFEIATGTHTYSILATLANITPGLSTISGLTIDSHGNLYGVTSDALVGSTFFELPSGSATISVLASNFSGEVVGVNQNQFNQSLTVDSSGNVYGTAFSSGGNDTGSVFEIVAGSGSVTVLASLPSGAEPNNGLAVDATGNIYGTTFAGGTDGDGSIFEVANGSGTITTLASFDMTDGGLPIGGVILSNGSLFGSLWAGSATQNGGMYQFTLGGSSINRLAVLNATEAGNSTLVMDPQGDLFVTTGAEYPIDNSEIGGGVYELASGASAATQLVSFSPFTDPLQPTSLVVDSQGNLFGATDLGGTTNNGVLFEIPSGTNQLQLLGTGADSLFIDSQGNVVGGNEVGGPNNYGYLLQLPSGSQTPQIFFSNANDSSPTSLTTDANGNLYGIAEQNISNTILFELPAGGGSIETLATLPSYPTVAGRLAVNSAGDVYWADPYAGGNGEIFEVVAGSGTESMIASFSPGSTGPGTLPQSLTIDSHGNLFGATLNDGQLGFGEIFEIPAGADTITPLAPLGSQAGDFQDEPITVDSQGNLCGSTFSGGPDGAGTLWELRAGSSTITRLLTLTPSDPGGFDVITGSHGKLYGVSNTGGDYTGGAVYEFDPVIGPPAQLTIDQQPSDTSAGNQLGTITVEVDDADNNLVTADNSSITVSAGGASLNGTLTEPVINGVATFSDLSITKAGSYSLSFTDSNNAVAVAASNNFTISPASPAKLVFANQPSSGTAGATLSPISVNVEDRYDNIVTSDNSQVTLSASGLAGTTTLAATKGVATFNDLCITKSGDATLSASDSSLTQATSDSFTITASTPASLHITAQPTAGTVGQTLSPITVEVDDQYGNPADGSSVSLTILNFGGNPLSESTQTLATQNGIASFTNLSIPQVGPFTFSIQDGSLPSITSSPVTMTFASPQLVFFAQPASELAGSKFSVQVDADDTAGNLMFTSKAKVTLQIVDAGNNVVAQSTATLSKGRAIFSKLSVRTTGNYTLHVTTTADFAPAQSDSFEITPGAAKKLVFANQPDGVMHGNPFNVQLELLDQFGNVATNDNSTVTLALGTHPKNASLAGTTSAIVSGGDADMDSLLLTASGPYSLKASDGKLKATTKKFIVI